MTDNAYTPAESDLLGRIRRCMTGRGGDTGRGSGAAGPGAGDVAEIVDSMELNIRRLSEVFYGYPSILDPRGSGEERQSVETLVDTLFHGGIDHTVLLPTKVVVGRSFMIAKFNLFGYLRKLGDGYGVCAEYRDELQSLWEAVIFSLLLEDVYQVIIERRSYDDTMRRRAAVDLIHLWDHRFDQKVNEYAPTLVELWSVRRRLVPVFGTLMGTMELLRLSSLLPEGWYGFLERHGDDEEVILALEEFLFGLSYEDLCRVREDMARRGISAINREELGNIPGIETDSGVDDMSYLDPREMYRFYQDRMRRGHRRETSATPGPTRTIEELLLVDMIDDSHDDG